MDFIAKICRKKKGTGVKMSKIIKFLSENWEIILAGILFFIMIMGLTPEGAAIIEGVLEKIKNIFI